MHGYLHDDRDGACHLSIHLRSQVRVTLQIFLAEVIFHLLFHSLDELLFCGLGGNILGLFGREIQFGTGKSLDLITALGKYIHTLQWRPNR